MSRARPSDGRHFDARRSWSGTFLRSKRCAEVATPIYTFFETAKLSRVDPSAYVLEAARRTICEPGTVTLPEDLI